MTFDGAIFDGWQLLLVLPFAAFAGQLSSWLASIPFLVRMVRLGIWAATALSLASIDAASAGPVAAAPTSSVPATVIPDPSCTQTPVSIPNGGFESGSLSPWSTFVEPFPTGSVGSVAVVSGGYNNSKYAVQLSGGSSASISQHHIHSCQATAYTISYAYKVVNSTLEKSKSCALFARAYLGKRHYFEDVVDPLHAGNWTTSAFLYKSNLVTGYSLEFSIECDAKGTSATVLLDDIRVTTAGSLAGQGCPKTVGLTNGGFDTGQFAPWVAQTGTFANAPHHEIVAPGDDSPYALQMDFGPADFTLWDFNLNFTGLCDGYDYEVSFATNWLNYTGPPSGPDGGCSVEVVPFGCQALENENYTVFATSTPGWVQHSYQCQSSTNAKVSLLDVEVNCESATTVPAFSLQMDSFSVQLDSSASAANVTLPPANQPARRDGPAVPR